MHVMPGSSREQGVAQKLVRQNLAAILHRVEEFGQPRCVACSTVVSRCKGIPQQRSPIKAGEVVVPISLFWEQLQTRHKRLRDGSGGSTFSSW